MASIVAKLINTLSNLAEVCVLSRTLTLNFYYFHPALLR
uniref:Uncharacterized protein n=1 Tax=Anguilla anguilla TaxID=7936 RepID=A0A0E9UY63_ANGAN